ncbi:alpha/beta fold hydrolase [Agromyces sp. CFH 90414]|uniref:Alpha/beta fold hydrolase n=1 Tax=Agromyces agglutinans TaxID=2662258 RepID=A0A6I2F369_9MICO|nr:alpha/beta hydrolase [Agromyces agglutinans]MRG58999.1 alpha/beta fold hydrolase [Agromyces agglutinans]
MTSHLHEFDAPDGPGSVAAAPDLPAGFTTTFHSRLVDAGGLGQHVVIGGDGPPLLLVHGWPESWYAWRFVMPTLARTHTVIAVDQRGMGLTGKPEDGYDAGTLARDLAALMDALGHDRFGVVGHDTGMVISYALAADFPDRVERLVVAEIPGAPGAVPAPPLFVPQPLNDKLWHIPFNRAGKVAEQLIRGREDIFFGYEFAIQGGPALPQQVIEYYIRNFLDERALRGGLGFYREWDATMAQNQERAKRPLQMPVLAIGGAQSWGAHVAEGMEPTASDVQAAVVEGAGHWVAEQAPEALAELLTGFLVPVAPLSQVGIG